MEENTLKAKTCNVVRRFLVEPSLASLVAEHMGPNLEDSKAVIFECHPGGCTGGTDVLCVPGCFRRDVGLRWICSDGCRDVTRTDTYDTFRC